MANITIQIPETEAEIDLNYTDLASEIELGALAEEIDLNSLGQQIAENFDSDEIAQKVAEDVAIDESIVAQHIDLTKLAELVANTLTRRAKEANDALALANT
jgi:hypothetical protein